MGWWSLGHLEEVNINQYFMDTNRYGNKVFSACNFAEKIGLFLKLSIGLELELLRTHMWHISRSTPRNLFSSPVRPNSNSNSFYIDILAWYSAGFVNFLCNTVAFLILLELRENHLSVKLYEYRILINKSRSFSITRNKNSILENNIVLDQWSLLGEIKAYLLINSTFSSLIDQYSNQHIDI